MKLKLFFTVIGIVVLSFPIFAQSIDYTKRLNFGNLNKQENLVGVVKGFHTRSYKFKAKVNQFLRVNLESDIVHFNVYSPNKSEVDGAIFDGSSEGTSFHTKIKKSGIYTIKVYLSDKEATNGEKIIYTLDIGLE